MHRLFSWMLIRILFFILVSVSHWLNYFSFHRCLSIQQFMSYFFVHSFAKCSRLFLSLKLSLQILGKKKSLSQTTNKFIFLFMQVLFYLFERIFHFFLEFMHFFVRDGLESLWNVWVHKVATVCWRGRRGCHRSLVPRGTFSSEPWGDLLSLKFVSCAD